MLAQLQTGLKILAGAPSDPLTNSVRALAGPRDAAQCERPRRERFLTQAARP